MKKYILRYGIIASLLLIGIIAVSFAFQSGDEPNYSMGEIIGYVAMIVSLSTIFVAIKRYRDYEQQGLISFGKALKIGVMISLMVAGVFVVFDALYITVIEPDWTANYQQYTVEEMQAAGASSEAIEQMNDQFKAYEGVTGVVFIQVVMFITVFVIGLLISLISSAVLKNNSPATRAR